MHSIAKRVTALGFIALIILGNIWLMSMFTGKVPPAWTATAFFGCICAVAIGGLGLLGNHLMSFCGNGNRQ